MKNKKWIASMVMAGLLLSPSYQAMAQSDANGIDISINGMPIEEMIGSAAEMFAGAVEENASLAIDGLNAAFDEFARGFSESLGEIEGAIGSMMEAAWHLRIPAIGLEMQVSPDAYTSEENGGSMVCLDDESRFVTIILEAAETGALEGEKIFFGSEHGSYEHSILDVSYRENSDNKHEIANYGEILAGGGPILTVNFRNDDGELTITAQEDATLLE